MKSRMLGYEVVRVEEDMPALGSHYDAWLAPALDCFALRETVTRHKAYSVADTLTIIKGNPSPALFAIPAYYTERSPSEVGAEFARRFPERPPVFPASTAAKLDQAYQLVQSNRK